MLKNENIHIRDPFIFTNKKDGKYYMYGSTDKNIWGKGTGFDLYIGEDLENWEGPYAVFRPKEDFCSEENFWSPEVHEYKGSYYIFATFSRKDNGHRGIAVLCSDSLLGEFEPHSEGIITPKEWNSVHGTLYVDDSGLPWMVFCHEWIQVGDGEICAAILSKDLKRVVGQPILLFHASEASWPAKFNLPISKNIYVADGTFMYKAENGELLMLWASLIKRNMCAQGISRSVSGNIKGPWIHDDEIFYQDNDGRGMIFKTFEGKLMFALNVSKKTSYQYPNFIPIVEENGKISVIK